MEGQTLTDVMSHPGYPIIVDLDNGAWTDSHFWVTDDVMGQGITSRLLTDVTVIW